jgi:hypothetical protein
VIQATAPAPEALPFEGERPVTPEVVREHNLNEREFAEILAILGRTPTLTELGIFSALWSEHCSYKHTRPVLKTFPVSGPQVVQGPGENAGVLRLPMDGRSPSRSNPTTIPARWSPTRAPPPGWAESCATCSPWAPARWPC